MGIKPGEKTKKGIGYILSALGAAGGALQNYSAVELFIRGLTLSFTSVSNLFSGVVQVISIAGGACNGLVNFFINVELLEGFLQRITSDKESIKLSGWRKFRYYAGILIFAITGSLFGMMAFAFSAATPISILAIAAGIFVAIIMTIQEVETWLQSFDENISIIYKRPNAYDKSKIVSDNHVLISCIKQVYQICFRNKYGKYEEVIIKDAAVISMLQQYYTEEAEIKTALNLKIIQDLLASLESCSQKTSLKNIFKAWWSTLTFTKACGHFIAIGNVLALSLLFTLSLVEVLMFFQVAALPALVIGLAVAFTFGAFTEFYFYNFFLAKFCNTFNAQWEKMKSTQYAPLGYVCITTNAFVNAALTYAGVSLLSGVFILAGIAVPPLGLMIGLAAVSAVFSAAASLILGMDFWIRKMSPQIIEPVEVVEAKVAEVTTSCNLQPETPQTQPAVNQPEFSHPGNRFFPTIPSELNKLKDLNPPLNTQENFSLLVNKL